MPDGKSKHLAISRATCAPWPDRYRLSSDRLMLDPGASGNTTALPPDPVEVECWEVWDLPCRVSGRLPAQAVVSAVEEALGLGALVGTARRLAADGGYLGHVRQAEHVPVRLVGRRALLPPAGRHRCTICRRESQTCQQLSHTHCTGRSK